MKSNDQITYMNSQGHNPIAIANYFLNIKHKDSHLTLMQILKLSYIAHGFTLALLDKPLSEESVEAWRFGPVFPSIYRAFRENGSPMRITKPIDGYSGNFENVEKEIMQSVFDLYGKMDAWELSELTHEKNTPWYVVFKDNSDDGEIIKDAKIKEHYKKLMKDFKNAS